MVVSAALVIPIRARINRLVMHATQRNISACTPNWTRLTASSPLDGTGTNPPWLPPCESHCATHCCHYHTCFGGLLHSCTPADHDQVVTVKSVLQSSIIQSLHLPRPTFRTLLWPTLTRLVHRPRPGSNISLSLISMISCRCLCLCLCLCKCQCQCLYLANQYQTAL